ncbi:MAG: ABC transporter substrate-binding protein [Muribaculaceae bacterium]|nr:ABC transporter substrate-binding protein [Muribaculaceae bacterium]MDE6754548.1 ABC transporter substrate-binding protein [Muribaculaceae bacterium]
MKSNKRCVLGGLVSLIFLIGVVSCQEPSAIDNNADSTYKIAVVMPDLGNNNWQNTVKMAIDNLEEAQYSLTNKLRIEVEWIDENAPELSNQFTRIANDDSYVAMIGPYHSSSAYQAAVAFNKAEIKKPLILPVATSTEFQRVFADKDFIWNLTESDLTQCEILLTEAKLNGKKEVSLIVADTDYGKTYIDWFAFQASEIGLKVNDVCIYSTHSELRQFIERVLSGKTSDMQIIFTPEETADLIVLDNELKKYLDSHPLSSLPSIFCSDTLNSSELEGKSLNFIYEGLSPTANPNSGFINHYHSKFSQNPKNGEAQLYDAVMMVYYGLVSSLSSGDSLNASMLKILNRQGKADLKWLPGDIASVLLALEQGDASKLSGVSGDWTFDSKTHTTILNTTYAHWIFRDGKYYTIEYISTDGGQRTISTLQTWDEQTRNNQYFDENQRDFTYAEYKGNWAVVIGASDTWANYRHQADAIAMYQILKSQGYPDDRIIMIMEDNIAFDSNNLYQGIIRVEPDGENIYRDVNVDYHLSDLTISDLNDILTGHSSERVPVALESCQNDNIVIFWCGHGNFGRLAWGSNASISSFQFKEILTEMHEAKKYRKIFIAMDACYSGSIAEECLGIPGVLFMTSANSLETSKADMKDETMGIWLSNGFTRGFRTTIADTPDITIRDLYYKLVQTTVGSHVSVYNTESFGNLYHSGMNEFLRYTE